MNNSARQANQHLVDQLIARGALWSPRLIEAFRATPRHLFLDRVWNYQRQHGAWGEVDTRNPGRNELRLLYADRALTTRLSSADAGAAPISSSSQPSLMAEMLEDLRLEPGLRVLEIGAGTGYNAALLAHVVGRVVSLDVDRRVLAEAEQHLRAFPDRQVELRHGDGRLGCPEEAPFDRILVTAAALDLQPAWLEQLADDGLLLVPLDLVAGLAYLAQGICRGGVFDGRLTRPAYFMPLRDEEEGETRNSSASLASLPPPEALPTALAPWAEWVDRKTTSSGPGLLPSLAFLAWLHGYNVAHRALADGRIVYGIGDGGHACWLGLRDWHVSGDAGRDLGNRLWHAFLEAGGPWPTEFRLRAAPLDAPLHVDEESAGHALVFHRRGCRCRQMWTLDRLRHRPTST